MTGPDPSQFSWIKGWTRNEASGRDRRESERAMKFWQQKVADLGEDLTIAALDINNTNSEDWSNRFLISVDSTLERSTLLLYGPQFARLLHLPPLPRPDLPMVRQLPTRYGEVFLHACAQLQQENAPLRVEGEVGAPDGRIEQYRAVFIPIGVKPNSLTCFAFGAFNSRVVDAPRPA